MRGEESGDLAPLIFVENTHCNEIDLIVIEEALIIVRSDDDQRLCKPKHFPNFALTHSTSPEPSEIGEGETTALLQEWP